MFYCLVLQILTFLLFLFYLLFSILFHIFLPITIYVIDFSFQSILTYIWHPFLLAQFFPAYRFSSPLFFPPPICQVLVHFITTGTCRFLPQWSDLNSCYHSSHFKVLFSNIFIITTLVQQTLK